MHEYATTSVETSNDAFSALNYVRNTSPAVALSVVGH